MLMVWSLKLAAWSLYLIHLYWLFVLKNFYMSHQIFENILYLKFFFVKFSLGPINIYISSRGQNQDFLFGGPKLETKKLSPFNNKMYTNTQNYINI